MKCPSCGMALPSSGDICPYCHSDISAERSREGEMAILLVVFFVIAFPLFLLGLSPGWAAGISAGVVLPGYFFLKFIVFKD